MNSTILDKINNKVEELKNIEDLDEKLENIKSLKEGLHKQQQKIYKHKTDIENENNYIIDDKYKNLSFQELKKLFEENELDLDSKLKIYQTYSKRLIMLEDELFEPN
tara:strand:- start:4805 stop:5125 length:321 start_codon:yes stop_codon:yes gene_type:complete